MDHDHINRPTGIGPVAAMQLEVAALWLAPGALHRMRRAIRDRAEALGLLAENVELYRRGAWLTADVAFDLYEDDGTQWGAILREPMVTN